MHNIDALVRARRSVRTFEDRPIAREDLDRLCAFFPKAANPYGLPVEFRLLDGSQRKLSCPVAVDADLFVGAK